MTRLWKRLGAHVDGDATRFGVWAPHATAVSVVGDFCDWDARTHRLDRSGDGTWHTTVADVGAGELYQFAITSASGDVVLRSDPLARRTQRQPQRSSVVEVSEHSWRDAEWIAVRAGRVPHREAMSVYEVHLGSWRRGLSYLDLAEQLVPYVAARGFTHVELMPVMEHPFSGSWGYQVSGYYAPTSRFGSPDDLRALVDAFHAAGIAVILDWVPAHFPDDDWALDSFDGAALYDDEAAGQHAEWRTRTFDLTRPEVREFLVDNALYWLEEFHADGLRVDAVASMLYLDYGRARGEWTPNHLGGNENLEAIGFLQDLNTACYLQHPGIVMIAEDSTAWSGVTTPVHLGGLGFGFKWSLGWMHDTLAYLHEDPLWRQHRHREMTFSTVYAQADNFLLPLSHDEVVHGKGTLVRKMPGDRPAQLSNVRALLAWQWAHPGKQLLFMGQDFAHDREWSEKRSLDWDLLDDPAHAGVRALVDNLNAVYRDEPALWRLDHDPAGFAWITSDDSRHNVFSFVRRDGKGRELVCVANFSGIDHPAYSSGLPGSGPWASVVDTDAAAYGGGGDRPTVVAEPLPHQGQPASAVLHLPALSVVWLRPEGPA